MVEDHQAFWEGFRLPAAGWESIVGVILVLVFLVAVIYLAYKIQNWRRRARALSHGQTPRLRKSPRIEVEIPVELRRPSDGLELPAQVLDISLGGVQILVFSTELPKAKTWQIISEEPPWNVLKEAYLKVLFSQEGPANATYILHCRWYKLSSEKRRAIEQRIRFMLRPKPEYIKSRTPPKKRL
ncbi:hypothetical protein GF324_04065 [bacterium]|nr:hypothetical protein [bacterium]